MFSQDGRLSKLQPNLLLSEAPIRDERLPIANPCAFKKTLEIPTHIKTNKNDHELLSDHSRINVTVANVTEQRRLLGGNAFAEHFIRELESASRINRGPQDLFNSSRLHWDVLLGRDETIEPCDYLNYEFDAKF